MTVGPVTMSPRNCVAPVPSLISTLWGTASLLSKRTVKGVSAGAVISVCSNAMPTADTSTASAAGAPEGEGDPPGAAEPLGEGPAEAPADGAADAPADGAGLWPPVNSSCQQAGYGVAPGAGR